MTTKWGTRIFAGVALTVGLLGLAGPSYAQNDTFRIIVSDLEPPLVPNSVMDLAVSLGYFEREGVTVELVRVQQTPSIVAALQAGEGDMGNIAVSDALQLVGRDQFDLVAVMSPNKSLPYLIAARNTITDIAQLAGTNYGVGRVGSLDYSLTRMVFEQNGVNPDGVNYVPVGQPGVRLQALAAGQGIDATTASFGAWLSLPDKTGLHILVDPETYFAAAPVVGKVNVVSSETLAEKADQIEAVIRAVTKLSREISADPSIWVEGMVVARPDVARADLELLAETFAGTWSVNGGMSRTELEVAMEFNYASEDFVGVPQIDLEDWVDFTAVDAVLAELGTDPAADPADR